MTDRSAEHDDLNRRVTSAIFTAERLPEGPERERAFVEVGQLEESIAAITAADSVEGHFARKGVVLAALSAGDPLRAQVFASQYIAEGPESLAAELRPLIERSMRMR